MSNAKSIGRPALSAVAIVIVLCASQTASAGGLGRQLVRGLTYALSPSVGSVQNGPNANDASFSQRFNQEPLTDGYSYEFFRVFGDDTYGNRDFLNTGLLDISLGEPDGSGFQGAGVYSRIGVNPLIVPEVYWDARTSARNVSSFQGASSVSSPLQYSIESNVGIEQMAINGQIQLDSSGSVNTLGFYDINFTLSNTGTMRTEGVLDERTEDISFDVGPIDVSGNVLFDATLTMLEAFGNLLGVSSEGVPALKGRSADEIVASIEAGESITMRDLNALLTAYTNDPTSVDLASVAETTSTNDSSTPSGSTAAVPEPGSLFLLMLAGSMAVVRRSRIQS